MQSHAQPVMQVLDNSVDAAILEFLDDLAASRSLQIKSGKTQLDARDFMDYLGIDYKKEPEFVWIAREMCAAPLPSNTLQHVSKSGLVYFHDPILRIYTVEHPLTQRFLKILELQRIDSIALRRRPAIQGLLARVSDLDIILNYPHVHIPCVDCGLATSSKNCQQCVAVYCDTCFGLLHNQGPRSHHTFQPTASAQPCSNCPIRPPQVYCSDCNGYLCLHCFELLHRRGRRSEHSAILIASPAGNVAPHVNIQCEECCDARACIHCDICKDNFCLTCFWRCHLNGNNKRRHIASLVIVQPLCNQCDTTRATLFCEQCQEFYCSLCFGNCHARGQRKLHLFMDAVNFVLTLEKLEPSFQTFIVTGRLTVLRAISKIQALFRGFCQRKYFRRRRELATVIQKRWRGGQTRKNLLGMLDQFNWRKRQVTSSLARTGVESKRAAAAAAKLDIVNKHQDKAFGKLGSVHLHELPDSQQVIQTENMHPPSNPTAALRSRISKNQKESEKLRSLLNLND